LCRGQERFPARAGGQALDVVGAEVLQKARRIGAGHFDLAPVRLVEQVTAGSGLLVFARGVAVMSRHQPAGFFGKDGSGLGGDVVERRRFGHQLVSACGNYSTTTSALCASCRNRHEPPASSRRCTSLPLRSGVAKRSSTTSSARSLIR